MSDSWGWLGAWDWVHLSDSLLSLRAHIVRVDAVQLLVNGLIM